MSIIVKLNMIFLKKEDYVILFRIYKMIKYRVTLGDKDEDKDKDEDPVFYGAHDGTVFNDGFR